MENFIFCAVSKYNIQYEQYFRNFSYFDDLINCNFIEIALRHGCSPVNLKLYMCKVPICLAVKVNILKS